MTMLSFPTTWRRCNGGRNNDATALHVYVKVQNTEWSLMVKTRMHITDDHKVIW